MPPPYTNKSKHLNQMDPVVHTCSTNSFSTYKHPLSLPCFPNQMFHHSNFSIISFFFIITISFIMEAKSIEMNRSSIEDDESGGGDGAGCLAEEEKKKASMGSGRGGSSCGPSCQAERCGSDLTDAKRYHRRHKVREFHSKVPIVMVAGLRQRFCQQCSRLHDLGEFDEAKRSCRRRLAGHNKRRRQCSAESCNMRDAAAAAAKATTQNKASAGQLMTEEKSFHIR